MRHEAKGNDPAVAGDDGLPRSQAAGQGGLPRIKRPGGTDDLIRKMMTEQRRKTNLRNLPAIMPDMPESISPREREARRARMERRQAWGKALDERPSAYYDAQDEEAPQARRGFWAGFFLREAPQRDAPDAQEPRTERRYALSLILVSVLIFQPAMIPGLLTLIFWTLFAASLLFGPGRVVDFLQGLWRLFLRRHPVLAARLCNIRESVLRAVATRLPGALRARWMAGDAGICAAHRDDSFDDRLETGGLRG